MKYWEINIYKYRCFPVVFAIYAFTNPIFTDTKKVDIFTYPP